MTRRSAWPARPRSVTAGMVILFALGCGGDGPQNEPEATAGAPADEPVADASVAVGEATLSIGGGQVVHPGSYGLDVSCSLEEGVLTLNLASRGDIIGGPVMGTLQTGEPVESLAEGSHIGRYDIAEEDEAGNIERFAGEAEIRVVGSEAAPAGATVANFTVQGEGDDGVSIEVAARCVVRGA